MNNPITSSSGKETQRPFLLARQTDETTHESRQRHDADMSLVAIFGDKIQSDREAKIGDEWEWMCWVHSQRCEDGKNVASEKCIQIRQIFLAEIPCRENVDVLRLQFVLQLPPA
jgi:hypothetical protein